jgi:Peptidase S46
VLERSGPALLACGVTWSRVGKAGILLLCLLCSREARADEGMWPFNHVPRAQLARRYGFAVTASWLEHVQRASVRVSSCSGSFVSAHGLTLTNQHCALDCLARLSNAQHDLLQQGSYAHRIADERVCPGYAVLALEQINDVTARIRQATGNLEGQAFEQALLGETARIEAECPQSGGGSSASCEVVSLYHGGLYELYHYHRYDDVRLVFAPEQEIAQFGGDPDNFNFPRFDLDVTFLRAYEHGQPAHTAEYLTWSTAALAPNELTFMSGTPGSTERQRTVAELAFLRDHALVEELTQLAGYRGFLTEYGERSAQARRWATPDLYRVENTFKELSGARQALLEPSFFQRLVAEERELRQRVDANPSWRREYGGAWAAISEAMLRSASFARDWLWIEGPPGFRPPWAKTSLFFWARSLVRAAAERLRDNAERLPEYGESRLPALGRRLLATQPLNREFEIAKLAFGLTALREALGADHPFVRQVLGRASPGELARELVQGSRLERVAERERLWRGGQAALVASKDRMIQLALAIDAQGRALRAQHSAELDSVLAKHSERVARARFAVYGMRTAPDATSSPRLSFGTVRGWREPRSGRLVPAFTTLGGVFQRATGRAPYALPQSWLRQRAQLALDTPFNFATDDDVVGGNSGSPVLNRQAELVGLLFDGNLHSLAGAYGFDITLNRAVAVDARAILQALDVIYGARRLTGEIAGAAPE